MRQSQLVNPILVFIADEQLQFILLPGKVGEHSSSIKNSVSSDQAPALIICQLYFLYSFSLSLSFI